MGAATAGGVMLYSGLTGTSVMDVLAGKSSLKDVNQAGGKGLIIERSDSTGGVQTENVLDVRGRIPAKDIKGKTPKQIIDVYVLPLARKHHIAVTPLSVKLANARHSVMTTSGNRSDHKGPANVAWAADMSNGVMTPEEMALAHNLATLFGISVPDHLNGIYNATWGGFRFQLIHGCSDCGGDHTNHVHFGVHVA